MKTALIGIGSPFGDDLAGWEAVDRLAGQDWVKKKLQAGTMTLMKLDRPGLCLLDYMRAYDHVILVDAVIAPRHSPGMLLKLRRTELATLAHPGSAQCPGVADTLAMGDMLGMLPKRLEIWGVVVAAW